MPTAYKWLGTTNAWATTTNLVPTGTPVTGDSLVFDQDAAGPIAASDQHAVVLTSLLLKSTFVFQFGDAATAFQIGATSWRIGDPSASAAVGNGSGRINLNAGTTAFVGVVVSTATNSTDVGKEPVRIKGVNTSNFLTVLAGRVGVATDSLADVATLNTISVLGSGAIVNIGAGVTLPTLRQTAGVANIFCAITTAIYQDGGVLTTQGSGAIAAAYISGNAILSSTGTITTLDIDAGGVADLLQDYQAKTITTVKLHENATLKYDPAIVTITNPIQLIGCNLEDVTIITPNAITVAIVKT